MASLKPYVPFRSPAVDGSITHRRRSCQGSSNWCRIGVSARSTSELGVAACRGHSLRRSLSRSGAARAAPSENGRDGGFDMHDCHFLCEILSAPVSWKCLERDGQAINRIARKERRARPRTLPELGESRTQPLTLSIPCSAPLNTLAPWTSASPQVVCGFRLRQGVRDQAASVA